ncbi:MAG: DJ-1/PfpI family protein [bacterium]
MKRLLLIPLIFLYCGGGKNQPPVQPKAETKQSPISKSVLIVIAPKDFRDEEFKEPYDLLTNSGIKVVVASTDTSLSKGMLGMVVKPQTILEAVEPDGFDGIVVIGGTGCQVLWNNETLHKIIKKFDEKKKTIGAICIAPVVLARAGILKDKKATAYPGVAKEIIPLCANYTAAELQVSEHVITASGPKAAKDFAKAILEAISK